MEAKSGVGRALAQIYATVRGVLVDQVRTEEGVYLMHDMAEAGAIEAWTGSGGNGAVDTLNQSDSGLLSINLTQAAPNTLRYTASLMVLEDFSLTVEDPTKISEAVAYPLAESLSGSGSQVGPPFFAWNSTDGSSTPFTGGPISGGSILVNLLPRPHPMLFGGYQQPGDLTGANRRWTGCLVYVATNAFGAGTCQVYVSTKSWSVFAGNDRKKGWGLRPPFV